MSRESSRVSWQREIYYDHFARASKNNSKARIFNLLSTLLILALLISMVLPTFIQGGLQRSYLLLLGQQLPGMGVMQGTTSVLASGAGSNGGFTLHDLAARLLLGSELAGFRSAGRAKEVAVPQGEEKALPFPEDLPAVEEQREASPLPSVADQFSVSLLAGTASSGGFTPLLSQAAPKILIYHTHGSESFIPVSGKAFSGDPRQSVVFLGEYLAEILEQEHNIPVLHHRESFDLLRSEAYTKARPAIEEILKRNPQIEIVVDLHRDGISREITTTILEGQSTARLLFVVGTRHEGWNNNLRFSLFLQGYLEQKYPGLCRGTRKQAFIYNQHLHPRSILVEVGGHENNREEVLRAIPYLAEALAGAFY